MILLNAIGLRLVSSWRRARRGLHQPKFWFRLEGLLAITLILTTLGSYLLLSGSIGGRDSIAGDNRLLVILGLNATLLLLTSFFVLRRIYIITQNRKRGLAGSRLHARMTRVFAVLAVVPTVLVAAYATLLFDYSSSPWMGQQISRMLSGAEKVADAYINETEQRLRADAATMKLDLEKPLTILSPTALGDFVQRQTAFRNLDEAFVFEISRADGSPLVLAGSDFWSSAQSSLALQSADVAARVPSMQPQELITWLGPDANRPRIMRVMLRMQGEAPRFLVVGRQVSSAIVVQADRTRSAMSEYKDWNERRRALQRQFMGVLAVLAFLILLAAIWAALYSADQIVEPIGKLIRTAELVGKGDFKARVPVRGEPDDLAVLAKTFNRMTSQLQGQTQALISANEQLDIRRRFTEAVLSGVSAGVLGIDSDGVITLPNVSAENLLEMNSKYLIGQSIAAAIPDALPLIEEARLSEKRTANGLVAIHRDSGEKLLMVRVTAEENENSVIGFVVTFDDVTEAVANQRRAAWSDVARRIAHEIKNPLTPIQLSAERLRRKYLKDIVHDRDIFINCTDTIIRQVNDLRRMVDEFSSFARMPRPVFNHESVNEVIRQQHQIHYMNLLPRMLPLPCSAIIASLVKLLVISLKMQKKLFNNAKIKIKIFREKSRRACIGMEIN
jgi:two-component system, NtrC family, nitrogen regulation sensor histidine kinase NtrY